MGDSNSNSDSDSDSLNRLIQSTPEGERKRVVSNEREIAAFFDDIYQQNMGRFEIRDILSLNFIRAHKDDFDDKGSDRYVYTGSGATECNIELDCGKFVALGDDTDTEEGTPTTDDDTDTEGGDSDDDENMTFSLSDGPTGGDS